MRRLIQIGCLLLFLALLAIAAANTAGWALDLFLRLDPALVLLTAVSARTWTVGFYVVLVVIGATVLWGRLFCGYVCPMGTSLDATDWLMRTPRKQPAPPVLNTGFKYLVLFFLFGAALCGIAWVFWASPLALITRLYGLLIYPIVALIADKVVALVHPLADYFDWRTIAYAQIDTPRFATQFFILFFFVTLVLCARLTPRFWCRYLCPAGALLGLIGIKPLVRRRVSEGCTQCGKCVRRCPMDAIDPAAPMATRVTECVVCRTCKRVCPENVIAFTRRRVTDAGGVMPATPRSLFTRRQFVTASLSGAGSAALCLTGLNSVYARTGEGQVQPAGLIRPPGALPEKELLARCVRCGECMVACPTNTLQPIWLTSGIVGVFSPALTPRRGYCDPNCRRCGRVCPTGAIRELDAPDRIWAKTGTAYIVRQKCLAWEHQKSCMVCDEVCPYDAIDFKRQPGNPYAVPHVNEDRCAGCGFCEHYCPVRSRAAIVVIPQGELRLVRGAYEPAARRKGLLLQLKPKKQASGGGYPVQPAPTGDSAPGFDLDEE